jgi:hypothetical protein
MWQSPDVLAAIGKRGGKLTGPLVKKIEPDITDSALMVELKTALVVPPLSPQWASIQQVQNATLVVDGRRSSMDVQGTVRFFMNIHGLPLRPGTGWSAESDPDGKSMRVTYGYIESEGGPAIATWSVSASREVRYVDSHGKSLSYLSPD